MRIGAIFPQTEIGTDPIAVRDYAEGVEQIGLDHILAYEHVMGGNPASRPGWKAPYTHKDMFYEPFVLFGYLAAVTKRLELFTGILILPQRQTVLAAKQSATVDVLSAGRLRLGVGIGWNELEYEALGENFRDRGRRIEEQIAVLRALWTQELVTFRGKWHKITDAGLNPLPVQRPIPIWMGGTAEPVIKRIARVADGWLPLFPPDEKGSALIEKMRSYAREAGRNPDTIGIEGRVTIENRPIEDWVKDALKWKELGATHISVNTMKAGLPNLPAHVEALRRFKKAVGTI